MKKLILHIPHSSTVFPFYDGFVVSNDVLGDEILKLTDWYTDDLFHTRNTISVKADFSRIFCDVERFADDKDEIMAQYGMGAIYVKTDDGRNLRELTPALRSNIMDQYYWIHHQKLNIAVNEQLSSFGKALILDCHSFPNVPCKRDLVQAPNRPDFNLGTDEFHTPVTLIEKSVHFFEKKGYSISIDTPYSGTIVPMEHYKKNEQVKSIMLEINRNLYLEGNTNTKSERFEEIKTIMSEYIIQISSDLNTN
jgi:N-formylglutamate amidohydrolase